MISFERSEKEIKEKKEQLLACSSHSFSPIRPIATAKPFTVPQSKPHKFKRTKGKISFIRTLVRVLCLLTVRYASPVPQIFSPQRKIKGVGGLFGV